MKNWIQRKKEKGEEEKMNPLAKDEVILVWKSEEKEEEEKEFAVHCEKYSNGSECWRLPNGRFHRDELDGPAVVLVFSDRGMVTKKWYKNGLLHRIHGPAIAAYDIEKESKDEQSHPWMKYFFLEGQRLTEDEWMEKRKSFFLHNKTFSFPSTSHPEGGSTEISPENEKSMKEFPEDDPIINVSQNDLQSLKEPKLNEKIDSILIMIKKKRIVRMNESIHLFLEEKIEQILEGRFFISCLIILQMNEMQTIVHSIPNGFHSNALDHESAWKQWKKRRERKRMMKRIKRIKKNWKKID